MIHKFTSTSSYLGYGLTFSSWTITLHFGDRRIHWFWA